MCEILNVLIPLIQDLDTVLIIT